MTNTKTSVKTQGVEAQKENKEVALVKTSDAKNVELSKLTIGDTLTESIHKVQFLSEKIEERKRILNHLERVNRIHVSDFASSKSMVMILDDQNNSYEIKNAFLVGKVADLLKNELQTKCQEVEKQISF